MEVHSALAAVTKSHGVNMASLDYDLIVLGAGQSGIVAARFYLDVHPECRLVIVERDGVVGGTWSKGK